MRGFQRITTPDGFFAILALDHLISFKDILSGMELAYVHELQHALRVRDQALNSSQRSLYLAGKVIESSLEGIMVTDAHARILSVNPAFTRMTGYTAAEVLGLNPSLLNSGRQSPAFYARMWESLVQDGQWQGEEHGRDTQVDGGLPREHVEVAQRDHRDRCAHPRQVMANSQSPRHRDVHAEVAERNPRGSIPGQEGRLERGHDQRACGQHNGRRSEGGGVHDATLATRARSATWRARCARC